jgi:hypothetical protein
MAERPTPRSSKLMDWLEYFAPTDPDAPGPEPGLWRAEDLVEIFSAFLPQTITYQQCLTIAKIVEGAPQWSREGADLVEAALARACELGKEASPEEEWYFWPWIEVTAKHCHSLAAHDRLLELAGLPREMRRRRWGEDNQVGDTDLDSEN